MCIWKYLYYNVPVLNKQGWGENHMERKVGTVSRGIRCPIIRQGDNLTDIVVNSVLEAAGSEGFQIRDRDVIAITESIVARAQGNYAPVDAIAKGCERKTWRETVGVIFPILSRNRFAICLRGIAKGVKKVVLMLSYPSDEVGNRISIPGSGGCCWCESIQRCTHT